MATGSNIGARPTQGITEDFGGIVQEGVSTLIAGDERRRQREKERAQQMADLEEKYGLPDDMLYLDTTEFRSVNDASVEAVSQYRDRYYDVYKQLQMDPTNIMLKKRLQSIKGGIQQLKSVHGKMKEMGEKYLKMVENDEISEVQADRWRQVLEAYDKGNVKIHLNDKDVVQLLTYDDEGQISDVKNFRELLNSDLMKRNDVEANLDTMAKRLGADQLTTREGGYLVTRNVFGDKQKMAASKEIDAYVQNDDVMADLYQQLIDKNSRRESGFTDAERVAVKGELLKRLEGRYGQQVDLKADAFALQAQGAAYDAARDAARAKADQEKKQPTLTVNTKEGRPQIDTDGNINYSLDKPGAVDAETTASGIKYGADGTITLVGQKLQKVRKNPDELTPQKIAALKDDPRAAFTQDKDTGIVTYNELRNDPVVYTPGVDTPENAAALAKINEFAARNGFGDEAELIKLMESTLLQKFPEIYQDLQRRNAAMKSAQLQRNKIIKEEGAPATAPAGAPAETDPLGIRQ